MSGSWTMSTTGYTTQGNWIGVASSSTGQKCIATNNQNTNIWISSDYGVSWSISPNSPTSVHWGNVTISQSGNKMAACEDVGGSTFRKNGHISLQENHFPYKSLYLVDIFGTISTTQTLQNIDIILHPKKCIHLCKKAIV